MINFIRFALNQRELIIIFVNYIITGFICATVKDAALGAMGGAVGGALGWALLRSVGVTLGGPMVLAVGGAVLGTVAWTLSGPFVWAMVGAVFWVVVWAVVRAVEKLEKSFTTFQAWLILLATCLIGFGVGWFIPVLFH